MYLQPGIRKKLSPCLSNNFRDVFGTIYANSLKKTEQLEMN